MDHFGWILEHFGWILVSAMLPPGWKIKTKKDKRKNKSTGTLAEGYTLGCIPAVSGTRACSEAVSGTG